MINIFDEFILIQQMIKNNDKPGHTDGNSKYKNKIKHLMKRRSNKFNDSSS